MSLCVCFGVPHFAARGLGMNGDYIPMRTRYGVVGINTFEFLQKHYLRSTFEKCYSGGQLSLSLER